MEQKHTKGKWSANGLHIMIEGKYGSQGQAYLQQVKPYGAAKWKDEEAIANAKLMAAAPDLLKSLCDIIESVDNDLGAFKSVDKESLYIKYARLAIEKATT